MKISSLVIITTLAYSCTAKKLAVTHVDWLLEEQVERRLPLYEEQKKKLSIDINKFLNDQKILARHAMPAIVDIELDVKNVDRQYGFILDLYKKLVQNFSHVLGRYMAQLDVIQQKNFLRILKEENYKMAREKADIMEKLEDKFESLFGTISDKQVKILESYKKTFEDRHDARLKRRELLHQRFAEIYELDLSQDARTIYFFEAFKDYESKYPDHPKNKEIIKSIIPTLSMDQREVFEGKIKEVKEIVNYYLDANY